uniref:Secreted protein n=1 Tax=Ixodes ricinus TaxID=34613 RepID=A0A6B0UXP9_IXORI
MMVVMMVVMLLQLFTSPFVKDVLESQGEIRGVDGALAPDGEDPVHLLEDLLVPEEGHLVGEHLPKGLDVLLHPLAPPVLQHVVGQVQHGQPVAGLGFLEHLCPNVHDLSVMRTVVDNPECQRLNTVLRVRHGRQFLDQVWFVEGHPCGFEVVRSRCISFFFFL